MSENPMRQKMFPAGFLHLLLPWRGRFDTEGQLINFLQVIIRRCGSKGQGEIWQGEQFVFLLYFCDKDEGYFFDASGVLLSSVPGVSLSRSCKSPFFHRHWMGLQFRRQMLGYCR